MRKELKYFSYSVLIAFVFLIAVFMFSQNVNYSMSNSKTVHFKKIISKEVDGSGPKYLRITGYDINDELVTEWIDISISKNRENHSVKMSAGISKEDAYETVSTIISKIDSGKLIFVPEKISEISSVRSGVYWYFEGNDKNVFVDFISGDFKVVNN